MGLLLNRTRHGRDTELCFDPKCCSSILSDSAGVKCAVVRVKGVDAPFAAVHSAPDGSFSIAAFARMVPGLVYTYAGYF